MRELSVSCRVFDPLRHIGYGCKSVFACGISQPNWIDSTKRIKIPVKKEKSYCYGNICNLGFCCCMSIKVLRITAYETKRISASQDVGIYFCWLESQIILFKVTKLYIYTVNRLLVYFSGP